MGVQGLWCHSPTEMNDPFECLMDAEIAYSKGELGDLRNYVKESPEHSKHRALSALVEKTDEGINKYLHSLRKRTIEKWAFCALSEVPDDVLMWSHYAAGHTGCVIGIDFPDDIKANLQKVVYADAPLHLSLIDWADFLAGKSQDHSHFLSQISVKGNMWGYEKEWRLWRNKPTYYRYQWEQIKEVYFGVKCSEDMMIAIANILSGLPDDFSYDIMEVEYNPARLSY